MLVHFGRPGVATRAVAEPTVVAPARAVPPGICRHCARPFDDHNLVLDSLTVECADHARLPLAEWLRPPTDLEVLPGFAHPHAEVLGTRFDSLDQHGVVDFVVRAIRAGRGGLLVPLNVDVVRQMVLDETYGSLVHRATLVLVDGAPLQWASRMSGHGDVDRTPGSSLMMPLAEAAAVNGIPMLLLGGRDGAAEQAAKILTHRFTSLDVRWHCPPFGFERNPDHWRAVDRAVAECDGGIVMCGLGAPKQEIVGGRLLAAHPRTWFLSVGATIDFTAGIVPRAPEWMQRLGIEWLYRLAVEPRRLFRRYILEDLPFVAKLFSWAARTRWREHSTHPG